MMLIRPLFSYHLFFQGTDEKAAKHQNQLTLNQIYREDVEHSYICACIYSFIWRFRGRDLRTCEDDE